jgi:ketosteroid isomerase-like protein
VSRENVEAVRRVYDGWAQGDFRASMEVFEPLVLMVQRPEFPHAGTYLGVERVAEYTRELLEAWTRFTIEAEEIEDAGDSVVVAVLQRGVGAASGADSEFRYFHVWSFRGPKVIRLENFRERAQALEAVGLRD